MYGNRTKESSEHHRLGLVTARGLGVKCGVQIKPSIVVSHRITGHCMCVHMRVYGCFRGPNKCNTCLMGTR